MGRTRVRTVFVDRTTVVSDVTEVAMLTELGECIVHTSDPNNRREVLERLDGADVVVTGHTMIDKEIMAAVPSVRMVCYLGVGAASYVDLEAARAAGVRVTNTPHYGDQAVAEHTLALLFAVARQIVAGDKAVREGEFPRGMSGLELRGKTLGVLGTGGIGATVAGIAQAIGMSVIAWTRNPTAERAAAIGVTYVPVDELFSTADVVSVHLAPHTETRGFVGRRLLERMRPGTILLNTARGDIVDTVALADFLRSGRLLGAGIDVFDPEPPTPSDPILSLGNVVLTPHVGYSTMDAIHRMRDMVVANVISYAQGAPQHLLV
jgi:D-3-phosphoglycerate dehydrogenase